MTGTGAAATAINGNKWRHRMKTSALGETSLSLVAAASSDAESDYSSLPIRQMKELNRRTHWRKPSDPEEAYSAGSDWERAALDSGS